MEENHVGIGHTGEHARLQLYDFFSAAKDAELSTFREESTIDLIIITGNKTKQPTRNVVEYFLVPYMIV